MDNNAKLEKLIDLNEKREQHEEASEGLKKIMNDIEHNYSARINISSYSPSVHIPATKDTISYLLANEENSLKAINVYIDDLLNGEANELKDKISEFSNSVKEKVEEDVEEKEQ